MRALSVAEAKAQPSALLDAVKSGEEVEITRAAERPAADLDLHAFLAATTNQPLHQGGAVATLREEARY